MLQGGFEIVDVVVMLLVRDEPTAVKEELEALQLLRLLFFMLMKCQHIHLKHRVDDRLLEPHFSEQV